MSIGNGFGALLTLLITAVAMAAAGQQLAAGQEEVSRAVERAKAAATAFTQELLKTLLAELKAGGPQRAVAVCSVKAAELARAHSGEGVELRRVTLKTRNPENRPDPFEERQLQAMAEQLEKTGQSKEVTEWFEEGHRLTVRYMRPIVVGEVCVTCHGPQERIPQGVLEELRARYPEDQAVGYSVGDFRGAVSVTVTVDRQVVPQR